MTSTSHWNATLLPITLSPGMGCLLGTCRMQIWSKLGKHMVQNSALHQLWSKFRNRLRTITTLVIVGQKWVIMCPRVVQARTSVYIKYLNMNTQEATIPSGNCTPGRPEWLRSVLSCHSLGFLLSVLCRNSNTRGSQLSTYPVRKIKIMVCWVLILWKAALQMAALSTGAFVDVHCELSSACTKEKVVVADSFVGGWSWRVPDSELGHQIY